MNAAPRGRDHGLGDPRNRPLIVGTAIGGSVTFLVTLLILRWPALVAWLASWTPPAFAAYALDKWQAGRGGWRVPEVVLHALALGGGVIGAWVGRLVLRHKTRKPEFLAVLVVAGLGWGAIGAWVALGH